MLCFIFSTFPAFHRSKVRVLKPTISLATVNFFSAHRPMRFLTYSFPSAIFDKSWTILAMSSSKNSETDIWPKKLSLNFWFWQVYNEWEQGLMVKRCQTIFLWLELLARPTVLFSFFFVKPLISCILIESSNIRFKSWPLALSRCRWISQFFLDISFLFYFATKQCVLDALFHYRTMSPCFRITYGI